MGMFDGLRISATGLDVERKRLNLASENIANMNNPKAPGQEPFRSRRLVSGAIKGEFGDYLSGFREIPENGVKVMGIYQEANPTRMEYQPYHPYADKNGFVEYPDVNILDEMVEASVASRNYQANLTTMNEAKKMFNNAFEIGK